MKLTKHKVYKILDNVMETIHVVEYLLHFQTISNHLSRQAIQSKRGPLSPDTISTVKIQTSIQTNSESPVLFSLRYNLINDGWKLPYSNLSRSLRYEKWLCPLPSDGAPNDVTVSVYTTSSSTIKFSILVSVVPHFQVGLDQVVNVDSISSASPVMYYIDIGDHSDVKKKNILEVTNKHESSYHKTQTHKDKSGLYRRHLCRGLVAALSLSHP